MLLSELSCLPTNSYKRLSFIHKMNIICHRLLAINFGFRTCTCNGISMSPKKVQKMITSVNCKTCLSSAGLHKRICWFCVVLFEGTSPLKNASTSPCIVPRLVTHMKNLHTCFAEIFSFVFSQQKIFCRSFEISTHRKIRPL